MWGMERQVDSQLERLVWIERAYASVPLSPAVVGAAIAGLLVLAFGVSEFALDRHLLLRNLEDPSALLSEARVVVFSCLLVAYLPTAYVYLLRGYRRTLDQVRDVLDCSDAEVAERRVRIGHYNNLALVLCGLAAVGVVLLITRATTPPELNSWDWSVLSQEARWQRVLSLCLGWQAGILILAGTVESGRLQHLATRVSRLDLLDLRLLRPFTRQALLNALLLGILVGIALLVLVESGVWEVVLVYWIVAGTAITFGLWRSLLPIHRMIRDAKRTQLDWCRDALIRERTKLLERGNERSRIDEMVAYRDVVEGVSTWPGDSTNFVRISLLLLIPLGSWAGGAIVERFIDSLLG